MARLIAAKIKKYVAVLEKQLGTKPCDDAAAIELTKAPFDAMKFTPWADALIVQPISTNEWTKLSNYNYGTYPNQSKLSVCPTQAVFDTKKSSINIQSQASLDQWTKECLKTWSLKVPDPRVKPVFQSTAVAPVPSNTSNK